MRGAAGCSRRELLVAGAGAVAAVATGTALVVADDVDLSKTPWIDAHSHIWSTDLAKYPLRNGQQVDVLAPIIRIMVLTIRTWWMRGSAGRSCFGLWVRSMMLGPTSIR